jgi:hypothetical protein
MATDLTVRFGFLSDPTELTWCTGCIKPLPDYTDILNSLRSDDRCYAGWFYPPLQAVPLAAKGDKSPPAMPTTRFSLPATHELTLYGATADNKTAEFYIALLGLLKGLRLQREDWSHFYKSPIKSGLLCDFVARDSEIVKALTLAADFWQRYQDSQIRKLMFGAIHWHLFAQLYPFSFERFNAQYMALDTCWRLASLTLKSKVDTETNLNQRNKPTHAERPVILAKVLGLMLPSWANLTPSDSGSKLSRHRNELLHEALYLGEPIAFAVSQEYYTLEQELSGFVACCIFGLIGINNEYTQSSVQSRQIKGFGGFNV